MNCGLDTSANALMESLTKDIDIEIPDVDLTSDLYNFPGDLTSDLYKEVSSVSNEDITKHSKEGEGTFDALMAGLAAHLDTQYKMNRITGDDYSKAYIALTEAAMANAVQFVLQRDTNKWAAINAQLGAITARVLLETEKAKLATVHIDALAAKTRHALGKTQLAISGVEHCAAQFRYENILPKESAELQKRIESVELDNRVKSFNLANILPKESMELETRIEGIELDNQSKNYNLANILPTQLAGMKLENDTRAYNLDSILPAQHAGMELENDTRAYNLDSILPAQFAGMGLENDTRAYNLDNILPAQYAGMELENDTRTYNLNSMLPAQLDLISEQTEVQRAQTLDTRTDMTSVSGTLGKQKELYDQQIESYKRNAETSAAKMFLDSWITQKSLDEDLTPPDVLTNTSIQEVLTAIKTLNGLTD